MGERFAGRYELVDHLGEGGGGSVWQAWDAKTGRYVAAKLLRQRDAAALLRFVREQSMRVAHPHVIAPHGWAAEDDDVLLTMDLVAGGSVATLLADYGSIPLPMTLLLVDQLLDALSAVHAAGLVHRDVKPANLLLEPTGTGRPFLRLADFGIAVALDDPRLTVTGVVVGTPGYVAPEAAAGAAPDLRQDLWSVAVLTRHLFTGVRPGTAPSGMPLDAEAQAPLSVHLPAEALAWIDWLGAPCLADRPRDAGAARLALRGLGCWTHPCWQPRRRRSRCSTTWPRGRPAGRRRGRSMRVGAGSRSSKPRPRRTRPRLALPLPDPRGVRGRRLPWGGSCSWSAPRASSASPWWPSCSRRRRATARTGSCRAAAESPPLRPGG
jgi:serine/threonine-protein kinase